MPDTTAGASDYAWVIEPRSKGLGARLSELWRYRQMVLFFASRAIRKLYQRTVLGRAWIVLRPLIPLVVRVAVFGALFGVSDRTPVPYFLFLAVGSAAWDLFASSLMWGTRSLELAGGILSRVYVPRLIIPIATMAPAFISFAISMVIVAVTLVYYRVNDHIWYLDPTWLVVAPVAIVLIVALAFSIVLFTSVLAIGARDVRFGLGYALEFWVYLTPVVYPLAIVPGQAQWMLMLNPIAVFMVAFRGAILGHEGPTPVAWFTAVSITAVALCLGLWYFTRVEAESVDSL